MKKRFFLKLALYSLPALVLLAVVFGVAIYSGEAMPAPLVAALQMADPSSIYGPTFNSHFLVYKLWMTFARQPQVLLMGSSRVFGFRSEFFNRQPSAFYNAGGAGWRLPELTFFLKSLDTRATPKVLLFQIDQPWFNPGYTLDRRASDYNINVVDVHDMTLTTVSVWKNILLNHAQLSDLLTRAEPVYHDLALGIGSITEGQGFRADGSVRLRPDALTPHVIQQQMTLYQDLFNSRAKMLRPGSVVAEDRLQLMEALLQYCQQRGITIIGFSGPFTPSLYDQMMSSGEYSYLPEAAARLTSLFEQYGFSYFDFTNPHSLGLTDSDFLDGWHGSEYAGLREYLVMLRQLPDVLGPYSDLDALQTTADGVTNPYVVFPPVG